MSSPGGLQSLRLLTMCQKAFRHFGRGQESDRRLKEILEGCESGETLEGSQIFLNFLFF